MRLKILTFLFILFYCSCASSNTDKTGPARQQSVAQQWQPPQAGTTIADFKQRITEDQLNELYFKVSILSTEQSRRGRYTLKLAYGHNEHEVPLTLPEWTKGTILKPMIKPGKERYHCFIGFSANDHTFHEFYEVAVQDGTIKLKQTKAYYLQSTPEPD